MIIARIISILIGYFAGLFQTGVIYGKIAGTDLRKSGSGNTGTTNSIRVLGWKAGVIVCAGDLLKAVVAIIVVWLLFRHGEGPVKLYMLYAGLGANKKAYEILGFIPEIQRRQRHCNDRWCDLCV